MKLMVIDGNSIINRSFYGIRPLSTREGLFTHAVYGFVTTMQRLLDEEQPEALCVAFDRREPTFRHQADENYKATRHAMPEELAMQMPVLKEVLDAMDIPRYELVGWEADDLIGTISRRCEAVGWDCVAVTGDKDSLQLITDHTKVKLVSTRMGQTTTKDMTHGVPWRLIAGFAIPVFLSQLFQQLYNTADSLIVSNFLGDNALAAVSASGPLIFLLISFFAGAASGVGVAIARYFGAGDYDKVSRTVHTAVLLGLISSLILTVIGVLFTPTLLLWMDTDPEVLPDAIGYFRCYFAGVGAGVMYNTFTGIMNALGDSKRPLYFLIVSSVTNVILDLLFVAVLRWGVWSAALATIISQALSTVLCVIHLAKKGTIYQLKLSALRLDGPLLREILRYGLPAGIQNSVIGLANVVVQTNINSFGKMATAAYGAYSKIEGFAFLPVTSFTMAITTYVGQNLGAGMKPRARKGAIFGIAAAAIIAELIGIATYLAAPWLVQLFSRTPEVIELGVLETRIICLFYCLLAFSHAIASVCRGAGKAFVPMSIMLGVWCVFRILYITVMMQWRHEIVYVYWAYPITWAISSVIYLFYFLLSNWQDGFDPQPEGEGHKHHHHFHLGHHK